MGGRPQKTRSARLVPGASLNGGPAGPGERASLCRGFGQTAGQEAIYAYHSGLARVGAGRSA